MDNTAFNYNILANTDNGSCIPVVFGCTDSTQFNYDPLANTDNGSCIAFIYGCTDATALNYNASANTDDGSCTYPINGCTDPLATNYNAAATQDDGSCVLPVYGCMDDGGHYFTSGIVNTLVNGTGVNGQANNYNPLATIPCDTMCEVGPDGITTQTLTDNPYGCCCRYSPGCTNNTYIEYDQFALQDAGSSIGATVYGEPCSVGQVSGCTYPGSTNYDAAATTDDGSCFYDGCVDDGSQYSTVPTQYNYPNYTTPWGNYVCLNATPVLNPNTNQNYTVGEWLCGCGNNNSIPNSGPCTGNDNPTLSPIINVEFIDSALSISTDTDSYNAYDPAGPFGSCVDNLAIVTEGCTDPSYLQNNTTSIAPDNYNSNATTDDNSCIYEGCTDSTATNYMGPAGPYVNLSYSGPSTSGYIGGTLIDDESCTYPTTYNCGYNTGCVEVVGTGGTFLTLQDCQAEGVCPTISYNCSGDGTGCVDPGNGTGTYTLTTAANASFLQIYPFEDYGDPLGQCQDICEEEYFICDGIYGCYSTSATSQPQGSFETLADCQIKCTSYNCNEQTGCTLAPPNTIGTYAGDPNTLTPTSLLSQCEDECKECSMVTATKCLNKTITKDFTCLEIDGFNGDPSVPPMSQLPNTSINSPYGLEQYFKDTPSSPIVAEQIDKIKPNKFIDSPGSSDPQEPAYSSIIWRVTTINNIFSTLPHTLRNSSTCYEGYNCNREEGTCYGTGTQIGSYTGPDAQADCESNCFPITFKCNRGNGTCSDPGDGTGTYTYTTAIANGFTGAQEECEGWGLSILNAGAVPGISVGFNVLSPAFLSALISSNPTMASHYNGLSDQDLKDEYADPYGNCYGIGDDTPTNTCFTGDTLITMPDNTTKRIDELKVDEIVKSEKETSQIQSIDVHEGKFDLYSINGSKHFVTEDHPFQTTDGWKAITPNKARKNHQIEAFVLKVGDILIKDNGEQEEITTLEKSKEKITTTTYNLRLDNEHVYYANNYLVHNGGVTRPIPILEDVLGALGNLPTIKDPIGKGPHWPPPPENPPGICCKSTNGQAVNHPSCLFTTNANSGFLGCCIPYGYTCPPGSVGGQPCYTLTDGPNSIQGSCENHTDDSTTGNTGNSSGTGTGNTGTTGTGTTLIPGWDLGDYIPMPDGMVENKIVVGSQSRILYEADVKESKLLRNLFKKEFMNASKPNSEAKLREAIKRMLKNKK
jgi:hypothetical protein